MRNNCKSALLFFLLLFSSGGAFSQSWMQEARIIGICNWDDVEVRLQEALRARVNVVDIHAEIPGEYEFFTNPEPQLAFIRKVSTRAHQLGLKTVLYIAGLECLSTLGEHTFYSDHPDWVQRNIRGEPAVFSSDYAFWIAPDQEDVWISPLAPAWRQRYMELVEMIAALPIDGIYMDIPYWMTHFEGWTDSWASFDSYTVAEFKRRTGLDALHDLRLGDFSDSNFLQWVIFRQQVIKEFIIEVNRRIKVVNPEMQFIIELYPGIEFDALTTGGDPFALIPYVDAISHETNPYEAQTRRGLFESLEFYINLLALQSFDGPKPTWMLTYASTEKADPFKIDALLTLAGIILGSGANFWETGDIHMCSTTTDTSLRRAIFSWTEARSELVYARRPSGRVGLYFSPWSRNFDADSYLQSFLGMAMLLLQNGYSLEIVHPRSLANFRGASLIVPSAGIVSDGELTHFANLSGDCQVIICGEFAERDSSNGGIDESLRLQIVNRATTLTENSGQQYYLAARQILNRIQSRDQFYHGRLGEISRRFLGRVSIAESYRILDNPFVILQTDSAAGGDILTLLNLQGLQAGGKQSPLPQKRVLLRSAAGNQATAKMGSFLDESTVAEADTVPGQFVVKNLRRLAFLVLHR